MFYILLLVHAGLCALWLISGLVDLRSGNKSVLVLLPLVVLVPGFGAACAFLSRIEVKKTLELAELEISVAPDTASRVLSPDSPTFNPIPLEEALEINDAAVRHSLMMQIIRSDPGSHIETLRMASSGSDSEVAHYATTAIMEIKRQFDVELQELEVRDYALDSELLNRYIDTLQSYINSGLLQGRLLERQRKSLGAALDYKIAAMPDAKRTYVLAAENAMELGDFAGSLRYSGQLIERWPSDEVGWIKALNTIMVSGNSDAKQKLEAKIRGSAVHWSPDGKEYADFVLS